MLRPISLMPPSAVTRKPPGASGPGGFEIGVHYAKHRGRSHVGGQRLDLVRGGRHLGQPRITDVEALQPQTRLGHRHTAQPRPVRRPAAPSVTLILRAVATSPEANADNMSRS